MQTANEREQALRHIHLVAAYPGHWELRALHRTITSRMEPRGSRFFQVIPSAADLLFDGVDQAVDWAHEQHEAGAEVFISVSPRSTPNGKAVRDVATVTTCFADIDLGVHDRDTALTALLQAEPAPSVIISSGGGFHALWLLEASEADFRTWRAIQRAIVQRFAAIGADPVPSTDVARLLRLVPFANRKYPEPVPTAIVQETDHRYTLAQLARAFTPQGSDALPDLAADEVADAHEEPAPYGMFADRQLTADQLQDMVDVTVATRHVLRAFVLTHMRPGVHFGIIPGYDGRPPSKPTLLKAGAELITILLGLHAVFSADTDTLAMYGTPASGVFAYVCRLVDRRGQPVGEGRGVAELREPNFYGSPNVASKMAEKRAYVDAVLRAAGLSNFFTQDLDEPLPPPPEPRDQVPVPQPSQPAIRPVRVPVAPYQLRSIRAWLHKSGHDEGDLLAKLEISALDQLSECRAAKLITRLRALDQQPAAASSG